MTTPAGFDARRFKALERSGFNRIAARYADGALGLAEGLILLPSNRARSAVQAAFVRAGGQGLLMPRLNLLLFLQRYVRSDFFGSLRNGLLFYRLFFVNSRYGYFSLFFFSNSNCIVIRNFIAR